MDTPTNFATAAQEPRVFMVAILLSLRVTTSLHSPPIRSALFPATITPTAPYPKQGRTLPTKDEMASFGVEKNIPSAAEIVP
jgi:hypothetical protein